MEQFIAYYRVSTQDQGKSGLGLSSQKESVERYINTTGGTLIQSFQDIQSGKNDINRENLNKAILASQKHGAILIVKKLDRLSRGGFKIAVRLEDLGVKYIESDSPNDNDLIKNIKLAMAKDEREKISERTKAALAMKKKQGVKLGKIENLTQSGRVKGAKAMQKKAQLNENNRRAKGYAGLLKEKGFTLQQIADELNGCGFSTSRGKQFQPTQVMRLLK
ncbi:recombinase family protein [Gramella jeungdoensis]|uniref:Recombinase family protein n=1 Tax=Gramella jeungdoensis TaxID=708091 RepID=A0ABT0Z3F2_9FLAO|nr:recombinase family protein [Gramella jeungdoensis]MCM8570266.1 recombinase family protein [Gramella jeungdoensis]